MTRLAIIHTTPATIDTLKALATELLPGAEVINFVDDSILPELGRNGGDLSAVVERLIAYARFAEQAGATIILEACSSVGELVTQMQAAVNVPVVRIDSAMAETAVKRGPRIGVAATLSDPEADPRPRPELATERPQIEQLSLALIVKLFQTHRYRAVAKEARTFLEGQGAGAALTSTVDQVAVMLITADQLLKDDDTLLRDGETYLRRAPGSAMFASIKQLMESAIARKRQVAEGREKAAKEVADLSSENRWDLFLVGRLYARNQQLPEAQRSDAICVNSPDSTSSAKRA